MVMTKTPAKVTLFDRLRVSKNRAPGWTTQDVADLYRIGDQLTQFGFPVSVHTGQTDEGDPWAVFERSGTDEVVVHVARIDGELFIVDVVRDRTHRGVDFRSLANELLAEAPLTLPRAENRSNVVLHPRMVMTAFVAAAFILAEFADPTTAEAAMPEDASEADLADGQGPGIEPGMHRGFDWNAKIFGRDGIMGGYSAQLVGMGTLVAGLAALSAHMVIDAMNEPAEDLADTALDAASLFSGAVFVHAATTLGITHDTLFETPELNATALDQFQVGKATVAENITERPRIEVEDRDIISAMTVSVVVTPAPMTEEASSELPELIPDQQELRLVSAPDQPAQKPVHSAAQPSMNATEAFARVFESVTVLDKTQFAGLSSNGSSDGAVVITMSDVPDDLASDGELLDSFSGSPSDTGEAEDTKSVMSEKYQLLSNLSQNVQLASDVVNILVYAGGNVEVSGFTFGRDSIAFIDGLTGPEWLQTVNIVGPDVVLVGQGGSVTLQDAATTFA